MIDLCSSVLNSLANNRFKKTLTALSSTDTSRPVLVGRSKTVSVAGRSKEADVSPRFPVKYTASLGVGSQGRGACRQFDTRADDRIYLEAADGKRFDVKLNWLVGEKVEFFPHEGN
jgi:hypothetical protein